MVRQSDSCMRGLALHSCLLGISFQPSSHITEANNADQFFCFEGFSLGKQEPVKQPTLSNPNVKCGRNAVKCEREVWLPVAIRDYFVINCHLLMLK